MSLTEGYPFRTLIHPNVVQFLGIYTSSSNEKFLITEYLKLGSLNNLLAEKKHTFNIIDLLEMCKHAAAGILCTK
jgi:hypothetical protein